MGTAATAEQVAGLAGTRPLSGRGHSRRRFLRRVGGLSVSLAAAALPGGCGYSPFSEAGPTKVPRIAYLDPGSADSSADELAAFREELRALGYEAYEFIEGAVAADLIAQKPDVIVAFGTAAIRAVKSRTETIPIVMAASSDPVGTGLIVSLARPGGNVTGLTSIAPQLTGKRLQILTHAFPEVKRVAYLMDPSNPGDEEEERRIIAEHQQLGVDALHRVDVTPPAQLRPNLARAVASGAQALVTFASAAISGDPKPILQLVTQHRLPAMYAQRDFVTGHGGLMAYGPDYRDMYRRAAVFVDKILRGHRPAELPVEKPRRFTLLLNRKSAQAQGLILSRSFVAQVDEVVES
jgi:putative tryptophan/tyrosine transport system substrate-binding protein